MPRGNGSNVAAYQSFLLRVWRSSRPNGRQWSARLEGLQGGDRWQFADVDALLSYLRALLDADAPAGPGPPDSPSTYRPELDGPRISSID